MKSQRHLPEQPDQLFKTFFTTVLRSHSQFQRSGISQSVVVVSDQENCISHCIVVVAAYKNAIYPVNIFRRKIFA